MLRTYSGHANNLSGFITAHAFRDGNFGGKNIMLLLEDSLMRMYALCGTILW